MSNIKKIKLLSLSHLKKRKSKVISTAILCFISLLLFMFSLECFSFNADDFVVREYAKYDANAVMVIPTKINKLNISNSDEYADDLKKVTGHQFIKSTSSTYNFNEVRVMGIVNPALYSKNFLISEYNTDFFKNENVDLIYGEYPSSGGEVLITKYIFDGIQQIGYIDIRNWSGGKIYFKNYEDIMEQTLSNSFGEFVIKGIVDTHVELNRYSAFNDVNENEETGKYTHRILRYELEYLKRQSIHSAIFAYNFHDVIETKIEPSEYQHSIDFKTTKISKNEFKNLFKNNDYKIFHVALGKNEIPGVIFSIIKYPTVVIGVGLYLFSIISLMSYIKSTTDENINNDYILSASGFSKKEIRQIYITEIFLIHLLPCVASCLSSLLFVLLTNIIFKEFFLAYSGVLIVYAWIIIAPLLASLLLEFTILLAVRRK